MLTLQPHLILKLFNNNNHIDNVHIKYSTQISTNVMNSLLTQTLAVIY